MAAPTPTTRVAPDGVIVPEGYKALITFARLPNAAFWEKTVQPAGITGGEINITTQHNNRSETFAFRSLYTPGTVVIKCGYDAKLKNIIQQTLINQPDTITETCPDGSTYCYYGGLINGEFGDQAEGDFPECTLTIKQTNYDHVNNVEAEAVFTEVVGT